MNWIRCVSIDLKDMGTALASKPRGTGVWTALGVDGTRLSFSWTGQRWFSGTGVQGTAGCEYCLPVGQTVAVSRERGSRGCSGQSSDFLPQRGIEAE